MKSGYGLRVVLWISVCVLGGLGILAAAAQTSQDANATMGSMEQQIIAKEREGLEALKTGDLARFGDLNAEDAIFIDARGPAGKAEVQRNVSGFRLTEFSMDNVEFRKISKDTGLIAYKITEKGVSHEKEFAAQAYVSSIWTRRKGKWVCLFSQETGAR